ncbi:hypothetical protein [Sphingosinicella xenopeptidilytica]|uniref:Uncharacterized protein n=1 Tax=Sphingosinicella xenopeptidilytica TaxID=364098 RepID=A0ABW3C6U6_SPHXN
MKKIPTAKVFDWAGYVSAPFLLTTIISGFFIADHIPYRKDIGSSYNGCFFTDVMIWLVDCRGIPFEGTISSLITNSFYSTVGLLSFIELFPLSLLLILPTIIATILSVRLLLRLKKYGMGILPFTSSR